MRFYLEGLVLKMQAVSERKKNLDGMSMVLTAFHEEERSGIVQLYDLSQTFAPSDAAESN